MYTKILAGIDEAGRGPLIGDMFIALVAMENRYLPALQVAGVNDSKKISKTKREQLLPIILSLSSLVIVNRIQPNQIDEYNINVLEMNAILDLIRRAQKLIYIDEVYIDAFTDPGKITEKVKSVDNDLKIFAEFKADSKYVVVGAASIVAKVLRDKHIESLKAIYGNFGSGYPSDRKTIEWLKNYYRLHKEIPPIVRRSWATVKKLLHEENRTTKTLFDYTCYRETSK
ncbi:MAG: ribonuclease HII [Ignisphaera sp.]